VDVVYSLLVEIVVLLKCTKVVGILAVVGVRVRYSDTRYIG